ncbi:MAG: biosynthetic-type acetolactate synthase large subunit [Erysipelotrichaceae bacterium]
MKLNGASVLVETLLEEGVRDVFGYPGGCVLDIYDALYKYSDRINHIITAHEQGAAHAADGYARSKGEVGVCIATSGPGATNLVTGIATAYLDSIPLVVITGNVSLAALGKDSFQEVDIRGVTIPITKHNYMVKDIKELKPIIKEAFMIARSGRQGPVLIDIPKNIQQAMIEYQYETTTKAENFPKIDETKIDEVIAMLNASTKPFIYCGGGVIASQASEELINFANNADAVIGTSLMGLTAIDNYNERFLGMCGMHGTYAASKAKQEADLVIAIGVRFSDRAVGDKAKYLQNAKIIHIDIDRAEIDKNVDTYMHVIGNVKDVLQALNNRMAKLKHPMWIDQVEELKKYGMAHMEDHEGITPKKIIEAVNKNAKADTRICTDVGQHQMWTTLFYKFKEPRTLITSGGLGTMGFGMGAAIGACIDQKGAKTVLFTGDGSFGMNLNELATATKYNLPLVIVIMNNGVLGMVRQWQTFFYDKRYSMTTLERQTDFVKLAEAFGAEGYVIDKEEDIEETVKKAFASSKCVVLDVRIDMDENVFPMIPPGGSVENIMLEGGMN